MSVAPVLFKRVKQRIKLRTKTVLEAKIWLGDDKTETFVLTFDDEKAARQQLALVLWEHYNFLHIEAQELVASIPIEEE